MKRLLMIVIALFLSHQATDAADISVAAEETPDHPALILIKGRFEQSERQKDVSTFSELAAARVNPAVIVFLEGPGGLTSTALDIGLIIKRRGFSTAVADNVMCGSGCALIWLAGKERFMGANALVGFHAVKDANTLEISSGGNAMVGAYFSQIGITNFDVIVALTTVPTTWLNPHTATTRYGIPVTQFSLSEERWAWAEGWVRHPPRAVETAIAIGTTGRVIRTPTVSGPGIWDTVPASLPAAKPIVPPVPQVRFRRFDETRDADTAQK